MKKKIFSVLALLLLMCCYQLVGQSYIHSVGAILGSSNGISYKIRPSEDVAIQLDLAQKFTYNTDFEGSFSMFTVELTPNIMRQMQVKKSHWDFLFGGGCVIGYNWYLKSPDASEFVNAFKAGKAGKFGINVIVGFEYVSPNSPLAVQIDFRPGYSLLFGKYVYGSCLDWGVNVGIRYAFK